MADHVAGGSGLTQFVDALRRDELDVHFVIEAGPMRPIDAAANPYRDGIEVSSEIWTELHSSSAAFLVSAELLDSFED